MAFTTDSPWRERVLLGAADRECVVALQAGMSVEIVHASPVPAPLRPSSDAPTSTPAQLAALERMRVPRRSLYTDASTLLADTLRAALGDSLSITVRPEVEASAPNAALRFELGTERARVLTRSPTLDTDDHATLAVSDRGQTFVAMWSPSGYGVHFAVAAFLERYLGVRWLFPGSSGTVIPRWSLPLTLSGVNGIVRPDYRDRTMAGPSSQARSARSLDDLRRWLLNNGVRPWRQYATARQSENPVVTWTDAAGSHQTRLNLIPLEALDAAANLTEARFPPEHLLGAMLSPALPPRSNAARSDREFIFPDLWPDIRVRQDPPAPDAALPAPAFDLPQLEDRSILPLFRSGESVPVRALTNVDGPLFEAYGDPAALFTYARPSSRDLAFVRFIPRVHAEAPGTPVRFQPCVFALRNTLHVLERVGALSVDERRAVLDAQTKVRAELIDEVAATAQTLLHPRATREGLSVAPLDEVLFCKCIACWSQFELPSERLWQRTYSRAVFSVADAVARRVFPDPATAPSSSRRIVIWAYLGSMLPPSALPSRRDDSLRVLDVIRTPLEGPGRDALLKAQTLPSVQKPSLPYTTALIEAPVLTPIGGVIAYRMEGDIQGTTRTAPIAPGDGPSVGAWLRGTSSYGYRLHPNVLVYITLTLDEPRWDPPSVATPRFLEEHAMESVVVDEWREVARQIGRYDYLYSGLVPRLAIHRRWAALYDSRVARDERGIAEGYTAELQPSFGLDGVGLYSLSGCLWRLGTQDHPRALIRDYCERLTAHRQAARALEDAFDLLEAAWCGWTRGASGSTITAVRATPRGRPPRAERASAIFPYELWETSQWDWFGETSAPARYPLAAGEAATAWSHPLLDRARASMTRARALIEQTPVNDASTWLFTDVSGRAGILRRLEVHERALAVSANLGRLFTAWNAVEEALQEAWTLVSASIASVISSFATREGSPTTAPRIWTDRAPLGARSGLSLILTDTLRDTFFKAISISPIDAPLPADEFFPAGRVDWTRFQVSQWMLWLADMTAGPSIDPAVRPWILDDTWLAPVLQSVAGAPGRRPSQSFQTLFERVADLRDLLLLILADADYSPLSPDALLHGAAQLAAPPEVVARRAAMADTGIFGTVVQRVAWDAPERGENALWRRGDPWHR